MNEAKNDAYREVLSARDREKPGSSEIGERVASYSVATAERMGLSEDCLRNLRFYSGLAGAGVASSELTSMKIHFTEYASILQASEIHKAWASEDICLEARVISLAKEYVLCEDRRSFESELRCGVQSDLVVSFLEVSRIIQPIGF